MSSRKQVDYYIQCPFPRRNISEKKDKEAALKQAVSDAKLWEMRFQAAEKSREAYRESGRRLMQENDLLQSAISQVLYFVPTVCQGM